MAERQTDKYKRELIDRIKSSTSFPSGLDPEKAFSAVMCTLTARLNRGEAVDLLNSLTADVRPLFERCAAHRGGDHGFSFDADQFYRIVGEHLKISEGKAEDVTRIVFQAIRDRIPDKEFKDIESELSKSLKGIWRAA